MPVQNAWGLTRPDPADPVYDLPSTLQTLTTELAPGPAKIAVAFAANWADFGAGFEGCTYYRHLGRVYLQGLAIRTGSTSAIGATLLTLPAGYRPAARVVLGTVSALAACTLYLEATGALTVQNAIPAGNGVSLTGLSFKPA